MIIELTKEQKMLQKEMQRFCKKELTPEYVAWMDENVDFPPQELWDKFNDIGYFRASIPEKYSGDGLNWVDLMLIQEPVFKASMSVGMAMGVNHAFGGPFIKHLGTEQQKREFLPKFAEGKLKTCMALTEPGGGTDILGALSTYAIEKEDRWVINGEKVFITGAHVADYMVVICKTEENQAPAKSLSIFLVPAKSEGITITKIPKISCHHCDSVGITFKDVEIPKENMLGTRGKGWYQLINVLNPERIVVALMGIGLMQAIYDECIAYVKQRNAFGGPIGRFQILQKYLADMLINIENARNLTYKAAWLCDQGRPYHVESNMAKVVAAEGAMNAAVYGAEIFGGYGICMEYPIQRYVRDTFQIQFSPISNEMARNVIMQFQGLPKSWP